MAHVVVIGSGLGGLAAAATAAARGHKVTICDKNPWLGGKAAVLHLQAPDGGKFRFDVGPTILTVPRVLRRIYAEAGRDQAQDLPLIRLDPQWRCFFEDGTQADLVGDIDEMAAHMNTITPGLGEGYKRFQHMARHLHDVAAERHEPSGSGVGAHVAYRQSEASRRTQLRWVVCERERRLRHAHRQLVEAGRGELLDLALCVEVVDDVIGAVGLRRDRVDLLLDRRILGVEELEVGWLVGSRHNSFGELRRSVAALLEGLVELGSECAAL
jgi:glycine/D-amino acid oxidase-like deaminating enzyme